MARWQQMVPSTSGYYLVMVITFDTVVPPAVSLQKYAPLGTSAPLLDLPSQPKTYR